MHEDKQKQHLQPQNQYRTVACPSQGVVISVNECASEEMSSCVMKYASTKKVRRESAGKSHTGLYFQIDFSKSTTDRIFTLF